MAQINRKYRISPTLTKQNLDANINRVFKPNTDGMNKYGLSGAYCYAWAKNALADMGVVQDSYGGVDAWDFFAGLPHTKMKYFSKEFSDTTKGSFQYDYSSVITEKIAFVFGFFFGSDYKDRSVEVIKLNDTDENKITKLKSLKRTKISQEFNPITHIGICANGSYYDFAANRIRIDPKSSFVPIAYYEFYNDLLSKLS